MPKVSFNEAYKQWRNRARLFDPQSVVHEVLRFLGERSPDHISELRKAPWLAMLLVKWVCQDRYVDRKPAITITRPLLDELRQRLWDFPGQLNRDAGGTIPLRLFMRQLLRPQLGFQRGITKGFVREAALLSEQAYEHPLRTSFRERTGFDVLDFIDLSLATFSKVMDGERQIQNAYFEPLRASYTQQIISSYQSSMARTFPQLVAFCRSLPGANQKVASEYFEFPVLSRYPFLRAGDTMICWHPTVFYRGLEGFVHSVLSEAGQDYILPFSRLFEGYVVNEAKKVPARFLDEDNLKECIAPETQVPDGLLSFPGCNVFIEAKAGLFTESVMTVGNSELFAHKTRAVRTAIGQAWATSVSLREQRSAPTDVLEAGRDYLLIVTNKELGASRGTSFASMYPEGALDYPSADAERLLPLGRVYVLSIEDFERLVSAAANGLLEVPAFLADCTEDDDRPETTLMLFEQHLNRHNVPMQFSDLVERALDASSGRLERALSEPEPVTPGRGAR